jgi:hypothetical protein
MDLEMFTGVDACPPETVLLPTRDDPHITGIDPRSAVR